LGQIIQANASLPVKYYTYFPYYEVTIKTLSKGGSVPNSLAGPNSTQTLILSNSVIAVGLADGKMDLERQLPGWVQNSFGFHSDDGCVYSQYGGLGQSYSFSFGRGDTVGCGLIRQLDGRSRLFFTLNGVALGTILTTYVPSTLAALPTIGADAGCTIRVNFGATPFAWKDLLSLNRFVTRLIRLCR